jgi:hypothetical protein
VLYLFFHAFPDQIGGSHRKKFYYQPFKDLLLSVHQLSMQEQQTNLDKAIVRWKGEQEQMDDILVMGLSVELSYHFQLISLKNNNSSYISILNLINSSFESGKSI